MTSKVLHRHKNPPARSLASLFLAQEATLKFGVLVIAQNSKKEASGVEAHTF